MSPRVARSSGRSARSSDAAVSPVIAVILMVAIAVVISAVVYVWVGSFSGEAREAPRTVSLVATGPIAAESGGNQWKTFSVASATPGLTWEDLGFRLEGQPLTYANVIDGAPNLLSYCVLIGSTSCHPSPAAAGVITAGTLIRIEDAALGGKTLVILDVGPNAAIGRQPVA